MDTVTPTAKASSIASSTRRRPSLGHSSAILAPCVTAGMNSPFPYDAMALENASIVRLEPDRF